MSLGVNTDYSGAALNSLTQIANGLSRAFNQASSGNRITNASVDPSGLAIYNALTAQAQGADTANENISDASNAINVAQGGITSIQSALGQVNDLAIEANNGFNSASDDAALQAQATQLLQQVNQDAGGINFNGTALLNGANAGNTPPTAATAVIANNDQTLSGGGVLSSASASGATTNGTFNVTVDNAGNADVTYTDSATQQTTSVGSFVAGTSTTFNGTTLNFGNFTGSDAGSTATVQATAASAGSTNPTISIQSGANAGQTTNISLPNATTSGLGIQTIDLSNAASATNAEGQIANAETTLNLGNAQLGAQSSGLGFAFDNNNVLSTNLTASASAIGSTNEAQTATQLDALQLQQQISIQTLNSANLNYGHLNAYLSVYA